MPPIWKTATSLPQRQRKREVKHSSTQTSSPEPAGKGVTRQVMGYDGQVMMVKVKFEKGAVGTLHTHYHTQTTYVASGSLNSPSAVKQRP